MTLHPLLVLMRLDKPIGIWLLFFPAGWAVALAAAPGTLLPLLAAMLLGSALTRAAGCIMNDLNDRRLDAQVERTRTRPLASGAVSPRQALALLALLLVLALSLALSLPRAVLALALTQVCERNEAGYRGFFGFTLAFECVEEEEPILENRTADPAA